METDITADEDENIVKRLSCYVDMGSEEEAANQLFDRDDEFAAPRVDAIKEEEISSDHLNSYWVTDPSKEVKLRMGEEGTAAEPPYTVLDMFRKTVEKYRKNPAIAIKKMGTWHHWTYDKYYNNCQTVAKAFIEVRSTLHSSNSYVSHYSLA